MCNKCKSKEFILFSTQIGPTSWTHRLFALISICSIHMWKKTPLIQEESLALNTHGHGLSLINSPIFILWQPLYKSLHL